MANSRPATHQTLWQHVEFQCSGDENEEAIQPLVDLLVDLNNLTTEVFYKKDLMKKSNKKIIATHDRQKTNSFNRINNQTADLGELENKIGEITVVSLRVMWRCKDGGQTWWMLEGRWYLVVLS